MARRRSHIQSVLKSLASLAVIPLLLVSVGYALYSQNLLIGTHITKPSYVASQNLRITYTLASQTPQGANVSYTFNPVTIKNNNANATTSWHASFSLPTGAKSIVCPTSVTCSLNGLTLNIDSTPTSATIVGGGTFSFSLSFIATASTAPLQNITIAGTLAYTYQTIPGLAVSASAGTRTKSGKWYYWPYTFTVTNNSGAAIASWQITANWSSTTNQVSSMDPTVNYTTSAAQITITGTTGLANGASKQFVGTLGSTSANWALSGIVVKGAL